MSRLECWRHGENRRDRDHRLQTRLAKYVSDFRGKYRRPVYPMVFGDVPYAETPLHSEVLSDLSGSTITAVSNNHSVGESARQRQLHRGAASPVYNRSGVSILLSRCQQVVCVDEYADL